MKIRKLLVATLLCGAMGVTAGHTQNNYTFSEWKCDSTWQLPSGKIFELSLNARLPLCSCPVQDAVNDWLNAHLERLARDTTYAEAGLMSVLRPQQTASPAVVVAIAPADTGKKKKKRKKKKQDEAVAVPPITAASPRHSLVIELECLHETPRTLTFRLRTARYAPATKGHERLYYATFVKPTGKLLTWNDLITAKGRKRFEAAVAKSLQTYFGTSDMANMKLRLKSGLSAPSAALPLPRMGAVVLSGSIYAQYEPGEITDDLNDQPLGILTAAQVRTLLTPLGKIITK